MYKRQDVVGGDFFTGENLPEGAAMYFMAYIIHDWGDAESTTILQNLARVMHSQSQIVVMDFVRPSILEKFYDPKPCDAGCVQLGFGVTAYH